MKVLSILLSAVLLLFALPAFAQGDPTTPPIDLGAKLFEVVMIFVTGTLGPLITTFMKTAPAWVRYVISGLVAAGTGALTGEFTPVPLDPGTMAAISTSLSLAIQRALHQKRPEPVKAADEAAGKG